MIKRLTMLVVLVLSLGVIAAGCGGDDDNGATSSTATTDGETAGTDFGAAELRANLTAGLQEHVYLAGIAFTTAAGSGFDSPEFEASAGALDKNTVALGDAIGSVYGDDAREQFLVNWRQHITDFVEYAQATVAGDEKAAKRQIQDLDGYRTAFGEFLAGANPNLTAEAVAAELKPHVNSILDTIDIVLSGEGDPFEALRKAAGQMPGTAEVLASAITAQMPETFSGDADSGAAALRATLTAGLQEHVYLAGITVVQGVSVGLDSPEFEAAAGALDKNTVALGDAIGSVYGDQAREQFLENWRQHISDFVLYTEGKATGSNAKVKEAQQNLDGYRTAFGEFLAGANPNLTAEAVAAELKPHVNSVFDTIDTVVSGEGDPFETLRGAAGQMPGTALVLSNAIAQQMPDDFPTTATG